MGHILTDCGLTEGEVETALTAVEEIRGEAVEASVGGRLRAIFKEMGHDSGSGSNAR